MGLKACLLKFISFGIRAQVLKLVFHPFYLLFPVIKKKKKVKKNEEMVIIENIVEDSIEIKYEDESTIHNLQVSVDLLKMTIQYFDFLGVENFNFIINPVLIDVANKLKVDEKKFDATLYEGFKFQNRIKLLKHSKYLFIWSGRFQISKMNSRTNLFQEKGFDARHNLLFNYCNLLFLVFLCKKRYFRFR